MNRKNLETANTIKHIHSGIAGFDKDIDNDDKSRIDAIVSDYERVILQRLSDDYNKTITNSDKIADKIASFGGSWKFILIMGFILIFWLVWNRLPFVPHFDSPPYILLNLLLSTTAAFQAPIIMMSQNRKAKQDKNESIIDFAINYKSEREIYDMQGHLHHLENELQEVKTLLNEILKEK